MIKDIPDCCAGVSAPVRAVARIGSAQNQLASAIIRPADLTGNPAGQ
jgi:hypothetical protein